MSQAGMSAQFIAIPVGQGDAFFLETPEGTVLVDGGRSIDGFADLFQRTTSRDEVDILICTHNDADHANGILGFLQSGLGCRELWLPGRWISVLRYALNPSPEVIDALITQVREAGSFVGELRHSEGDSPEHRPLIEVYGDSLTQEQPGSEEGRNSRRTEPASDVPGNGWPQDVVDEIERVIEEPSSLGGLLLLCWKDPRGIICRHCWLDLDEKAAVLLAGALDAADRIRKIALAAFHRGIAVRWFEYGEACSLSGSRWLRPLNAREVAYVQPVPINQVLAFLALTTSNRESLVFWACPAGSLPGVLFTADSDLKGVQLPVLTGSIITAPHHGSEANKDAYAHIQNTAGSMAKTLTWVRSDGRFRGRPGPSYLATPGQRICTLCRAVPQSKSKQAVCLHGQPKKWVRTRGVVSCCCV
ncbi:MAG TPA: MBL fold metallo-hydrolase [Nitrospiraceae bacterium]|jgi:hypothetical protein|nr:MBL fold metallo-hydrolase [Nitrospiraceae bacterium]